MDFAIYLLTGVLGAHIGAPPGEWPDALDHCGAVCSHATGVGRSAAGGIGYGG
jgi:hypothetical protein